MKRIYVLCLSIAFTTFVNAQNYVDALRVSENFAKGNAQFMGMSGAMGALGTNLSAVSINPAGSAISKKSIFEFTPSFMLIKTENHYLGNYDRNYTPAYKLPNIGFLVNKEIKNSEIFLTGVSYGFAYNSQNTLKNRFIYKGINESSSYTDQHLQWIQNNGGNSESHPSILFWDVALVDADNGSFISDFRQGITKSYGQMQNVTIQNNGSKQEYLFNLGFDFSDKVFLGADVSFENMYYSQAFSITETDIDESKPYLDNYDYSSLLEITGSGVAGKVGLILQPIEFLRLGIAAHSPSIFMMNDVLSESLQANYDSLIYGKNIHNVNNTNSFEYQITKPAKYIFSLGLVLKNFATFGVDYESINYSKASMYLPDEIIYPETGETESQIINREIETVLQNSENIKIGGEFRFGKYRLRGGMANYGSPYKVIQNSENFYRTDYSGGFGITSKNSYIDFAWVKSVKMQYPELYTDFNSNPVQAKSKIKTDELSVTFGFKF